MAAAGALHMAQVTRSRISKAQRALVALALANSAVGAGLHYCLWLRLVAATALGAPWQRIGACLFAGLALYVPVGLALVQYLPLRVARPFALVLYLWFGALALLLQLLGASELLRAALALLAIPVPPVLLSRVIAVVVLVATPAWWAACKDAPRLGEGRERRARPLPGRGGQPEEDQGA